MRTGAGCILHPKKQFRRRAKPRAVFESNAMVLVFFCVRCSTLNSNQSNFFIILI